MTRYNLINHLIINNNNNNYYNYYYLNYYNDIRSSKMLHDTWQVWFTECNTLCNKLELHMNAKIIILALTEHAFIHTCAA